MNDSNEYVNEYQQLVGYTVDGFIIDDCSDTIENYGQPCIGIRFRKGKKTKCVWVMSDPECNNVGFLDII